MSLKMNYCQIPFFGSNVHLRSLKNDQSLSLFEYRNMQENLEHDHMLMGNYYRQSLVFTADTDDGFYYTYDCDNGLIVEIAFLSCSPYEKTSHKNLALTERDDLMICGLRSPCPNSCLVINQ